MEGLRKELVLEPEETLQLLDHIMRRTKLVGKTCRHSDKRDVVRKPKNL